MQLEFLVQLVKSLYVLMDMAIKIYIHNLINIYHGLAVYFWGVEYMLMIEFLVVECVEHNTKLFCPSSNQFAD